MFPRSGATHDRRKFREVGHIMPFQSATEQRRSPEGKAIGHEFSFPERGDSYVWRRRAKAHAFGTWEAQASQKPSLSKISLALAAGARAVTG